ncbi:MAG: carboxyl transferase domain-containing protein, partial [Dehalococcoidales bacterium]
WKSGMEWEVAIEELRLRKEAVKRLGGKERVDRQHGEGKQTIRERIDQLADPGSFFEVGSMMGISQYDENGDIIGMTPAAYVTGLAEIDGRLVTIGGEDFTVQGGSPAGIHKDETFFMHPTSLQYGIPCVQLKDGAGANVAASAGSGSSGRGGRIPFPDGRFWRTDVQMLRHVPVVSAIMGPTAGHVAGRAMLCHFSIIVKGTGQVFPSGPPVVERALGTSVHKNDLGGSAVHARQTGVVDNEAEDEADCFRQIRAFLSYMPDNVHEIPARKETGDDPKRREQELLTVIPTNRKRHYDMRRLIRLLVDNGEFFEMREYFGKSLITAFAHMDGYSVGVLASNPMFLAGALDAPAANKMSRFIDLCNFFSIPVVILTDVPGLMIGAQSERQGTMRAGAAAVMAAQEATVPKVHIAVRKAYGVGNDAYSGVGGQTGLNLRLGWPSGEWGAIPIEGGVAASYKRDIASSPDPDARRRELEEHLISMRSPFRSAEAGDVIDMIDPRETRPIICRFIKAAQPYLKRNAGPKRSVRPL